MVGFFTIRVFISPYRPTVGLHSLYQLFVFVNLELEEAAFTQWFIANATLVRAEKWTNQDAIIFTGILRSELTETPA
jgi:hypothetical protein